MATKAIITRRGAARSDRVAATETAEAGHLGLVVEQHLPQGTLISGNEKQIAALEAQGYRVKLLKHTNILEIGAYRIDTQAAPPKVPPKLGVPRALQKTWPHHLVQLAAPPHENWIRAIEAQGVEVVEPVSAYGLFVLGSPQQVKKLEALPFVEWVGPFKPAYRLSPNLKGRKGKLSYVNISVYPATAADEVREKILKAGGTIHNERSKETGFKDGYQVFIVELAAGKLERIATAPAVRWLEFEGPPTPSDERSAQIVAENLDGAAPPNTAPVVGYQAAVTNPATGLGLSGAGVTVGICDTGVDSHNNTTMHPDLRNRMAFFVDVAVDAADAVDRRGHGTQVAGIAVGNGSTGDTDPQGFLLGQGMAPGAQFGSVNAIVQGRLGDQADWARHMVTNGAQVMNNSWNDDCSFLFIQHNYSAAAREFDQMVRNPDPGAAGLEYLVIVFSAGNAGGFENTICSPATGKNHIVAGNSLNHRPGEWFSSDDIRGIAGHSSRGLTGDNRILPTIVAPGSGVVSARPTVDANLSISGVQRPGLAYVDTDGTTHNDYSMFGGTSAAAPHVSGLCALLIEWWRKRTGGRGPSPALLKALLINGAEDLGGGEDWHSYPRNEGYTCNGICQAATDFTPNMVVQQDAYGVFNVLNQVATAAEVVNPGDWFHDATANYVYFHPLATATEVNSIHIRDSAPLPHIPNGHQGWGRASLENMVLQAPDSDRGPKIFSDQRHAFTGNGQEHVVRVAPIDVTRALRITLVWTDAAGAVGSGGSPMSPALVNDLDLEVTELASGNIYRGNINFVNGFSTAAGTLDGFDEVNNVECVYIENPGGTYEITIIAANIAASAHPDIATPWQDFALVIDNAEVPAAAPVSIVPVIDRSGSMVTSGYVDITRTSSRQFVDLMSIDDRLGVVSFGSTSTVEYPTGSDPTLQTIASQTDREDAKGEIGSIAWGGCTYMGAGINAARDLLDSAVGTRAMVLLSDGYDNKGCDSTNLAKPSALNAAAGLPANMPVYSCAMGPASDQSLLEQIAETTEGRYYYMPTIDDLFEIYNYIRGQITGDAIVVNESATASSSRVAAFVDALATEATFTVAWADTRLRFVCGDPKRSNQISIRLRDPHDRLLHAGDSYVRRIVGPGYVAFKLQEPIPGRWYIEVATAGNRHVRYTVGGFVRSPIRLSVSLPRARPIAGAPLNIASQVFDGDHPISGFRANTRVFHPNLGMPGLLAKYKTRLCRIRPIKVRGRDSLPKDIARLLALRAKMLQAKKPDLFAHTVSQVVLREMSVDDLPRWRFGHLATAGGHAFLPDDMAGSFTRSAFAPMAAAQPLHAAARSGALVGQFKNTRQQGSYNVLVTAQGISPVSNTRFVRKELASVLIE